MPQTESESARRKERLQSLRRRHEEAIRGNDHASGGLVSKDLTLSAHQPTPSTDHGPDDLSTDHTEPDYGYSTGILTATEMETVLEDMKRNDDGATGTRKVYVYVESEATGRFFKYSTTLDPSGGESRRKDAAIGHSVSTFQNTREHQLARTKQAGLSIFLFLQGILAGFSVQTLYDAIPNRRAATFLVQYSPRANETRRFYIVAISLCLTCCLSIVVPPRERWSRERTTARQNTERWSLVVCYLTALILALPIAVVDVQLSALSRQANEKEVETLFLSAIGEDDVPNIRLWRALCTARSLFCIVAWMVACQQHFRRQTIRSSEAESTAKELRVKDYCLEGDPRRLEDGLNSR